MDRIEILPDLAIPADEVEFRFARGSGPGGQHADAAASKVQLRFDVAGSPSLDETRRARALERLASRLTDDGVLALEASEHRSQARNREAVLARFAALMAEAVAPPPPPRRPTRPSRAERRRRREAKARRAEKKRLRKPPPAP